MTHPPPTGAGQPVEPSVAARNPEAADTVPPPVLRVLRVLAGLAVVAGGIAAGAAFALLDANPARYWPGVLLVVAAVAAFGLAGAAAWHHARIRRRHESGALPPPTRRT